MSYIFNSSVLGSMFAVPAQVVDNYIKFASASQLKTLLWICRHISEPIDSAKISKEIGYSVSDVEDALTVIASWGVLIGTDVSVDRDEILQEKYTTLFKSVVAFGKAEILTDENEMRSSVTSLAEKYCKDCLDGISAEVERGFGMLCMIKINIEHMTGKQGKELLKEEIR